MSAKRDSFTLKKKRISRAFLEISLCIHSLNGFVPIALGCCLWQLQGSTLYTPFLSNIMHVCPPHAIPKRVLDISHPLPNASSSLKKTWMLLHVSPSCHNRQIRMTCSQAMTWELLQLYSNSPLPGSESLLVLLTWNFVKSSQATSP